MLPTIQNEFPFRPGEPDLPVQAVIPLPFIITPCADERPSTKPGPESSVAELALKDTVESALLCAHRA